MRRRTNIHVDVIVKSVPRSAAKFPGPRNKEMKTRFSKIRVKSVKNQQKRVAMFQNLLNVIVGQKYLSAKSRFLRLLPDLRND